MNFSVKQIDNKIPEFKQPEQQPTQSENEIVKLPEIEQQPQIEEKEEVDPLPETAEEFEQQEVPSPVCKTSKLYGITRTDNRDKSRNNMVKHALFGVMGLALLTKLF